MGFDHGTDLTVQEAVGKGDEETLEADEDIPGEDEDHCQRVGAALRSHQGYQIGDPKQWNYDDQRLGGPQVDVLC